MMQRLIEHEKDADSDRAWLEGIVQKASEKANEIDSMDYESWQANQDQQTTLNHLKEMEERLIISQDEILQAAEDLLVLREEDLKEATDNILH